MAATALLSDSFLRQVCAYVPQQSILLSSLTPRESINFASKLRLPDDTTEEEHAENTERVIAALALNACANTRVGDELTGGGLSGGEKRRTNVAVELVTSPPLLCLDEPSQSKRNRMWPRDTPFTDGFGLIAEW